MLIATLIIFVGLVASLAQSGQPWPPGVPDILKLVRANLSDDTIVAYVKNTGQHYTLNAGEIIMLKQQGVSDQVLNAMLQNPVATAQPRPAVQPTYVVQPAYVATTPAYSYPYYSSYNPFYYLPPISLSFGWSSGGSYWGGGWHGGGWNYGGGWHGGWHH